jgi:cobalt-zinc-cadmium efflux system membrane fusion protein
MFKRLAHVPHLSSLLALLLIALASGCSRSPSSTPAPEASKEAAEKPETAADVVTVDEDTRKTIGLKVEAVERRPFAATIQTTGVVEPNATRVAHVRLLAPGRVESVQVRVGDRVREGQSLLAYDNVELGSLVGDYLTAAAAVDRAAAEADVARRALERGAKLTEAGGVSRAEYERREAEHKRTLAAVEAERAALANVALKLRRYGMSDTDIDRLRSSGGDSGTRSRTVVRAPFAGVVTATNVSPGEAVDTAQELITVADLSTVWVLGDVYQRDIGSVRTNQPAHVSVETYPGDSFTGRVTHVSDVLDPASRTAKVRVEVPNRDGRLKPGMFVTVQLPAAGEQQALVIPSTALQEIDGQPAVFVQSSDTTFQKRVIETGPTVAGFVPVVAGLKPGERVVTDGAFMLKSKLKAASIGEGEEDEEKEKKEKGEKKEEEGR